MKLRYLLSSTLAFALLAGCASEKGERENEPSQAQLQAEAKVSRADAERLALAQTPNGTIKSGELEKEKGKLIWSFDITTPGSADITEVNIDAVTGKVISTQKESPAKEAKEQKEKDEK